jgi:hypothetical protein
MMKRVHTMWPLPIVVAEASTCAAWGLAWAALFFCFVFEIFETTLRGVPNARRICFSFSVWHLLSLERIVRVNWGVENPLECFEKWKKMEKMKISVVSAHVSFLAWIVSDLNYETCLEIAKVMFPCWSVVRILIWAREPFHFPLLSFCPVPARAPSRTCTLRHSPTHMHAFHLSYRHLLLSFHSSLLIWYCCRVFCVCVWCVCVLVAAICIHTPTEWQDGLGHRQTTRPLGSSGSPPEMSKIGTARLDAIVVLRFPVHVYHYYFFFFQHTSLARAFSPLVRHPLN